MRVPDYYRPMLFGLPFVVCQMLVPQAHAWDLFPFNSDSQPANSASNSDLRAGSAVGTSADQRWMDRSNVEQASATDPSHRGTVLQAVWGDPSQDVAAQKKATAAAAKRRAAANNQNARANAQRITPQTRAPQSAPAANNMPTYHGSKVKVPQMPFARTSSKDAPPTRQRTAAPAAGNRPAHQIPTRQNTSQNQNRNSQGIATRPTNGLANGTRPNAASTSAPAQTSKNQPKFQAPVVASKPELVSVKPTAAAPSDGPTLESADGPELAEPSIAAAPRAPKSAAERLIVQAHELSSKAQTEEEYTRVVETCRHTLASQPTTPVAHYANELASWALNRRGQIKAESGRTKEASLDFDDAIRLNAECWRAIHNRGVLQAEAGNFEGAFDDFNRTVQLKPDFAKAYSNRAALFVIAGDLRPALQDYGKAIEFDPSLVVAQRGYGRVCHLMGRLDESIIHYDAAVQLAPQDAYAVASRADVLTDLGRYADAVADYDHAIQLDSSAANAYRGSAWLLATCPDSSVRDAALAVERAELAMQYDKKADSISYDTLAAAQASAGDFRSAVQSIRRAIEMAPANERDIYQNRLVMYQRAKPYRIAPIREQQVSQASFEQ